MDGAQGQEFDVIVLSMVLQGYHARAFINSPNRFNVMISRVKAGLIILADIEFVNPVYICND